MLCRTYRSFRPALLLLLAGRLCRGVADHRTLLVAAGDVRDNASCQRTLHELVEPVAVALLEGRSLRLPVIGEDDDLVRPRCEGAGRALAARRADPARA